MPKTAEYQICNLAYSMMGTTYAADQEMTTATFTTPVLTHHLAAVQFYDTVLYSLLSEYNWYFARKRIELDADNFEIDITSGTNASPGVITAAAHGIPEGCGVMLYGLGVSDLDYSIFTAKNVATNTFELYYPDGMTKFNTTASGTIGAGHARLHPITGYEYKFKLPTDFLRLWKVTEYGSRWEVENNTYLLTDDYEPKIEYVQLVTTVSRFPEEFVTCFARRLAREMTSPMADKPNWKSILQNEYTRDLFEALKKNVLQDFRKSEDKTDYYRESTWVMAGR